MRLYLAPLFAIGLGVLAASCVVLAQTAPLLLALSTDPVWAQDDGTPTSDQPAPAALSGPLFNGQAPSVRDHTVGRAAGPECALDLHVQLPQRRHRDLAERDGLDLAALKDQL